MALEQVDTTAAPPPGRGLGIPSQRLAFEDRDTTAPDTNLRAADSPRATGFVLPREAPVNYGVGVRSRLIPLQTWEGYVEEIDAGEGLFRAKLYDLTSPEEDTVEVAEFSIDDVDLDDRELFREGAVFRWIVGYREQVFGKRERISSLIFRRLPAWHAADLERAKVEAREISHALQWD